MVDNLCRRSSLFESMIELVQPTAVITVMATLPLLLRWVGHFEVSLLGLLPAYDVSKVQVQTPMTTSGAQRSCLIYGVSFGPACGVRRSLR